MLGFNNCGMNVPVVADIGGGCNGNMTKLIGDMKP